MPAAAPAVNLGPRHEEGAVLPYRDRVLQRSPKARPTGAGFELVLGLEDRQAAPRADECAGALFPVQRARAGPFRPMLAQDPELLRREAPAPLVFGEVDLEGLVRLLLRT